MRYELSRHAADVIAEREIEISWIEQVMDHPEFTFPDSDDPTLRHLFGRIREHGNRMLRVIVNHSNNPWQVVTCYFDRTKGRQR